MITFTLTTPAGTRHVEIAPERGGESWRMSPWLLADLHGTDIYIPPRPVAESIRADRLMRGDEFCE